jgi:hypothetical protein
MPKSSFFKGFATPDTGTIANDADGSDREWLPTVRANSLKLCVRTAADGEDANLPPQSALRKYAGGRRPEGADMFPRRCLVPSVSKPRTRPSSTAANGSIRPSADKFRLS